MSCEHKRMKSVNCVLYCADCGARLDKTLEPQTVNASGRKIGFEAEAEKPRRTRKKKAET